MKLEEFLDHFETVEEIMKKDPNNFPKKLYLGFWCKNDKKMQIELINDKGLVASLSYEALARNPLNEFKMFLRYRW